MNPSNIQHQQQMQLAAQQYQLQLAAFQHHQLLQQQQQQQVPHHARNPSRTDRRPPHPNATRQYANPFFAANGGPNGGPSPIYQPPMSYEMYQQMLFASGTIDATLFAAAVASGQVFQMYQAMLAQTGANGYYGQNPMQAEYSLQMQQGGYYAPADAATVAAYRANKVPATGLLPSPAAYAEYAASQGYANGGAGPAYGYNGFQAATAAAAAAGGASAGPSPDGAAPRHGANGGSRRGQSTSSDEGADGTFDPTAIAAQAAGVVPPPVHGGSSKTSPQPSTYKTEICRSHQATGSCEYGSSCQFSHGAHELRSREVDSKYKTELCRNFHGLNAGAPMNSPQAGSCWYGNRCRFLHDEFRLRQSANEFWLVAPSDSLIRVERVAPSSTAEARLEQLAELMTSEHNRKQTLLYAASVGCVQASNGELDTAAFQTHMQTMMQSQLSSQGEAQIHVREGSSPNGSNEHAQERTRRKQEEREQRELQHQQHQQLLAAAVHLHQQQQAHQQQLALQHHHQQQQQHQQLLQQSLSAQESESAASNGANKLSRGVVVVTPILPLSAVASQSSSSSNIAAAPSNATPTAPSAANVVVPVQTQPIISNTPVPPPSTASSTTNVASSQPMSYARKVGTAPPPALAAKVTPVSAAKPAPTTAAPVSTPAAATKALPSASISNSTPIDAWQTKVSGKRGNKFSPSKETLVDDQKIDHASSSSSGQDDDEDDLSHIIAKIAEVEMKEAEQKAAERKMDSTHQ